MRRRHIHTEELFCVKKLDDFVPAKPPFRVIRPMVNKALAAMGELFAQMYEDEVKDSRPSIAPEKLLRAMLLQVLYSIRSERKLLEQTQYNLLFRWFIGLSMDDAVVAFFNAVLSQADKKQWLSKEHFSVDGTLIQAWAGHKSFVRKNGQDDADGSDFRGQSRSNDTHESSTDPDSRLYRKGNTASELRFMGHALIENRNGLVVNAMVTQADGYAVREAAKAMIADARQVTPHVAQNQPGRSSAVPDEIAASAGYALSQQRRKLIRQGLGWAKFIVPIHHVMVRGIKKVGQRFMLTMAAYNLLLMRTPGQIRLEPGR